MIRYQTTLTELENKIDHEKPLWRGNAISATQYFTNNGRYSEYPADTNAPSPFWVQVKWVYLELQRRKCAYCERQPSSWAGDYAIEHFRPKGRIDGWPANASPRRANFAYVRFDSQATGYYLLVYHPLNYAAACAQCNTRLKRNFFPIAGLRDSNGSDPVTLFNVEKPYIIYPIGDHDDDPENLIQFNGTAPGSNPLLSTHDQRRAAVTIELFELDVREDLCRERAEVLDGLIDDLEDVQTHPDVHRRTKAAKAIRRAQSKGSKHSNCAKCFVALYRIDPARAKRYANRATQYLNSRETLRLQRPR